MRLAERVALIEHDAVVGGTVEALQVQLRVVLHRDDEWGSGSGSPRSSFSPPGSPREEQGTGTAVAL